ncbi:hypothetical protein BC831DRAFT_155355 [Entophlyctis helioformis]|nr:hypothetical protein BC831DRAFT_155355 [Entophlyctis helioformis]
MRWRLAMAHHDRVSAMRHIRAWRGYVNERRTVRTSLAVFIYKREVSAQSRVFSVWRERLMEHREYDDIVMSIRKLRGMSQAQAVIRAWKTWANTRMLKRRMEEARYQALACARRHDTLKHCFGQWLVVHRRKRRVQRLEQRALHIYQSSYLTRAFALWRGHYRHLVWERYTGELQVHFTQTHLLGRYMDRWVSRRPDWKRIYVARHVQPIAFWGLGLSRKVFSAWQQYVAQRRSSKARIAEAKAWHNRELVRLAVRQWFEADDCLRQERQWDSRTSDLSDREQQLGLKYGLRWRVKAMRLASMSGGRSKRMIHHRSADMHPPSIIQDVVPEPSAADSGWTAVGDAMSAGR